MDDGKVIIRTKIDSSEIDSGLREVEGKMEKSASKLGDIIKGISFQHMLEDAAKAAVKFAKDVITQTDAVNNKLKAASTLYQGVAVDQEKLVQGLSAIAIETGESLETLGQSVYDALSAGVQPTEDMADVLKVVQASAKLAAGGFTDTSTALSSTMKVLNSYSMGLEDLDRVQGILIQTQNSGITTVDELGASLAQVVPTAASFGVSFENVGAAIAEMTKQGTKTAQATTSLNALIAELGKNGTTASKNLKAAAEASGMADTSFQDMLNSGMNISDILEVMSDYAEENGLSMVDMFSSIEAGKASLQLTGSAGEDFNKIMDDMQNSAGLVQQAFEKTVSPADRLNAAWQGFATTLGKKLLPTVHSTEGALATMLTKLSGQYSAASDLKTEIGKLATATDTLKTAQEELEGSVDAANKQLLSQMRLDVLRSASSVGSKYKEAKKQIDGAKESMDAWTLTAEQNEKVIQAYADKAGKTFSEYVASVQKYTEDHPVLTAVKEEDWQAAVRIWSEATDKAREYQISYDQYTNDMENATRTFAAAVMSGAIDIKEVTAISAQLSQEVSAMIPVLEAEAKAQNNVAEGAENAADGKKDDGDETETVIELHNKLVKKLDETTKKYDNLLIAGKEVGKSFYDQEEKLEELKDLYIEFAAKGLRQADSAMEDLWKQILDLTPEEEKQKTLIELLSEELRDTLQNFQDMADAADVLGVTLLDEQTIVSVLTNLMKKYVDEGIDPSCDAMKDLVDILNLYSKTSTKVTKQAKEEIDEVEEAWKKVGESATKSLVNGVAASFETLSYELITIGDQARELEAELLEIGDKLAENTESQTIAEKELALAKKRGDEVAIANAEKQIADLKRERDGIEKVKKAKEGELESVKSTGKAWSSMGKAAVEALASTLEGIGGQLAGLAAVRALSLDGWGFGLATAASIAAYAAAGAMKAVSQKFATGGIVQGQSRTGDNVLVRANAGELILNLSQQDTLARILDSAVSLAELYAAGGTGGGITINMAGATIYGLDEPAVGKAIYENIEQLKYEGVIR